VPDRSIKEVSIRRFAESGDVGWMGKNQGRNIQKSIDVKQVDV
jgi:hypothetical protein